MLNKIYTFFRSKEVSQVAIALSFTCILSIFISIIFSAFIVGISIIILELVETKSIKKINWKSLLSESIGIILGILCSIF